MIDVIDKCPNCETPIGSHQIYPETNPIAIHFTCAQCGHEEWIK